MQLRFGRLDVRALLDQFRRQADRQILRQLQRAKFEFLSRLLARKPADQRRQQIALHRQLFQQWRQRRLCLRQRCFDRCDIQSGHLAELELLAKDVP